MEIKNICRNTYIIFFLKYFYINGLDLLEFVTGIIKTLSSFREFILREVDCSPVHPLP